MQTPGSDPRSTWVRQEICESLLSVSCPANGPKLVASLFGSPSIWWNYRDDPGRQLDRFLKPWSWSRTSFQFIAVGFIRPTGSIKGRLSLDEYMYNYVHEHIINIYMFNCKMYKFRILNEYMYHKKYTFLDEKLGRAIRVGGWSGQTDQLQDGFRSILPINPCKNHKYTLYNVQCTFFGMYVCEFTGVYQPVNDNRLDNSHYIYQPLHQYIIWIWIPQTTITT